MRFTYTYKTSDGVRHEAGIEARTRDDAFAALRTQGIRPIRVEEKPLSKEEKSRRILFWAVGIVLALACAAGAWWWTRVERVPEGSESVASPRGNGQRESKQRYRSETRGAFEALKGKAEEVRKWHQAEFAKIDFAILHNYALIERSQDIGFATNELAKGKNVIESSHSRMKDLFRDLYDVFPPESANERLDAQRLYGEIMNEIDASEDRLDAEECILALLDGNRSKWHVYHGRIVFEDMMLEREVGFFKKDTDGSTMRWKRDFKQSPLESPVVELPSPHAADEANPAQGQNSLPQPTE